VQYAEERILRESLTDQKMPTVSTLIFGVKSKITNELKTLGNTIFYSVLVAHVVTYLL